ncbi:hypothetical protein SAMN05720354_1081, partial [Nitrosospira sp. Nsp1]
RTLERQHGAQMINRTARMQLLEKPQPLLRKGGRKDERFAVYGIRRSSVFFDNGRSFRNESKLLVYRLLLLRNYSLPKYKFSPIDTFFKLMSISYILYRLYTPLSTHEPGEFSGLDRKEPE